MHLRSKNRQTATIQKIGLTVTFERDETIWTEGSHKYTPQEVIEMDRRAGFQCAGQWFDYEWPFAESLLVTD